MGRLAAGIVVNRLINPGTVEHWAGFWRGVRDALHFVPQGWMSGSPASFSEPRAAGAALQSVRPSWGGRPRLPC
ncbi:hypothetical protein ABTW95_02640 [Spirillospora sp. NPDC127506]